MITQRQIVEIKIDGIQHFMGRIMKRTRKMRVVAEYDDIFGCDPKL